MTMLCIRARVKIIGKYDVKSVIEVLKNYYINNSYINNRLILNDAYGMRGTIISNLDEGSDRIWLVEFDNGIKAAFHYTEISRASC